MKRSLIRLAGGILLGGVAMLAVLPACGGSSEGSLPLTATPSATPTATATATANSQPTPASVLAATSTPVPTTTASAGGGDLLAQGKLIFEKTAGGIGCAFCHGLDGRGSTPAMPFAPNIRGKDEGYVRRAIESGVPAMSFIKLSDEEITAVAAYLKYLNEQP